MGPACWSKESKQWPLGSLQNPVWILKNIKLCRMDFSYYVGELKWQFSPKTKRVEMLSRQKKPNAYSYLMKILFWHNELLRRVLRAANKMSKLVLQQNKAHAYFFSCFLCPYSYAAEPYNIYRYRSLSIFKELQQHIATIFSKLKMCQAWG